MGTKCWREWNSGLRSQFDSEYREMKGRGLLNRKNEGKGSRSFSHIHAASATCRALSLASQRSAREVFFGLSV